MNISIITTVDHNVGDDFVREGLKYLFRQYFKNEELVFQNIHKHTPLTSRHGFEQFRNHRLSAAIDKIIPKGWSKDRILEADIVVQSGAPVYWCHEIGGGHCYETEWYTPLIKERFIKNKNAKFLNLAAGTCQKYHSTGNEFCKKCNVYIEEIYNLATVTTLRDRLAKKVLSRLGLEGKVIPCSSIFAADEHGLAAEDGEYVVMNYMEGGAHYTFGQNIDCQKWQNEFKKFYFDLKKKENVIISCHNQKEVDETLALDPEADIFYAKDDFYAYMKFYRKAKFGIMNRVHGAFLIAAFGKPSIVIGNDSRAKMVEEIGLRSFFVNDVNYDTLNENYAYLSNGADNFKMRFQALKEKALKDYLTELSIL